MFITQGVLENSLSRSFPKSFWAKINISMTKYENRVKIKKRKKINNVPKAQVNLRKKTAKEKEEE